MGHFVDFHQLKERISFGSAINLLGLQMKKSGNQWRGACPACKTGGDRTLVVTDGKAWFCFAAKKGGDQIALAAHVRNCSTKDAAQILSEGLAAPATVPSTVPQKEISGDEARKALTPLAYLEAAHEAVLALGFDPEVAARLGIGYAGKGLMRGTVAVPIRDEHGNIAGYIGLEEPPRLPPDFSTNVVPFGKKTA